MWEKIASIATSYRDYIPYPSLACETNHIPPLWDGIYTLVGGVSEAYYDQVNVGNSERSLCIRLAAQNAIVDRNHKSLRFF